MTRSSLRPEQFARVYGHPGESSRSAGWFRVLWPVLVAAFCGGYLIRAAFPRPELPMAVSGLLLLGLGVVTLATVMKGEKKMAQYLKGAAGEERMARVLSLLPARYAVFHGLPSGSLQGGGDYDHVVVGPTGIFLIETKNWSGSVRLQGDELLYLESAGGTFKVPDRPPLPQVKDAAMSLESLLKEEGLSEVTVQPVLCFASPIFSDGYAGVAGVMVCNADQLSRVLLESAEHSLQDVDIKAVEMVLKKEVTS